MRSLWYSIEDCIKCRPCFSKHLVTLQSEMVSSNTVNYSRGLRSDKTAVVLFHGYLRHELCWTFRLLYIGFPKLKFIQLKSSYFNQDGKFVFKAHKVSFFYLSWWEMVQTDFSLLISHALILKVFLDPLLLLDFYFNCLHTRISRILLDKKSTESM